MNPASARAFSASLYCQTGASLYCLNLQSAELLMFWSRLWPCQSCLYYLPSLHWQDQLLQYMKELHFVVSLYFSYFDSHIETNEKQRWTTVCNISLHILHVAILVCQNRGLKKQLYTLNWEQIELGFAVAAGQTVVSSEATLEADGIMMHHHCVPASPAWHS